MSTATIFAPRDLTAAEYVLGLFEPTDNVAILVRNRSTRKTVQTIAKAEAVANPEFQGWLSNQSAAGYDVYVGMNPIKDGSYSRTKGNIKDIRHVYLDLDRNADASLEAIRNSTETPAPNYVLDTSPGKHQVVWRVSGFSQDEAESCFTASRINSEAISRQRTRRVCFACRDSPTANFLRDSSYKLARKAMQSTHSATSRLMKTRPKHNAI